MLGRYTILGKLTQGGMAEVYLARQQGPAGYSKMVVVKRVRPNLADDKDFVAMFVNEARLAALINHPNVVQIFDLGQDKRDWLLAMEFLDGRDMLQVGRACRAHNKAVPFDVTARIIADACAGLEHAHRLVGADGKPLNLVHRDMSPENILITFEGGVKVVDFGIAKARDNAFRTQAGQIKGKLGYVAPEAILGKPLDGRADIFAIGATLYLFLCGRPAFTGANPMEIFERSLQPPERPSKLNSRVPPELEEICVRCLERDPDKRYRSAGELRQALEGYLSSTGRPLGPPQLGQFMKILFPADKDPVRQRIDLLISEGNAAATDRHDEAEDELDDDSDATAVVPPEERPDRLGAPTAAAPPAVELSAPLDVTAQGPAYGGSQTASGQAASGYHLRSVEVASQLEKPKRPQAVEVTASRKPEFSSEPSGSPDMTVELAPDLLQELRASSHQQAPVVDAPDDDARLDDLQVDLDLDEDDLRDDELDALEVTQQSPRDERPFTASPPPLGDASFDVSQELDFPADSLVEGAVEGAPEPISELPPPVSAEEIGLDLAVVEDEREGGESGPPLGFPGPASTADSAAPLEPAWKLPDLAGERERRVVRKPASAGARFGMLALGMAAGAVLLVSGLYALGEIEWAQARMQASAPDATAE